MGYAIKLNVHPALIKKYNLGYQYGLEALDDAIVADKLLPAVFEDDVVGKEREGIRIEHEFRVIVKESNVEAHYDDLLYYILCQNTIAHDELNHAANLGVDHEV